MGNDQSISLTMNPSKSPTIQPTDGSGDGAAKTVELETEQGFFVKISRYIPWALVIVSILLILLILCVVIYYVHHRKLKEKMIKNISEVLAVGVDGNNSDKNINDTIPIPI